MKVVIMAGGLGSRLASISNGVPKPLMKISGIPILEREIFTLKEQGFKDIILTLHHKADMIMDYFGDGSKKSPVTGKPFDVHIEYFVEKELIGNAGALYFLKEKLCEDFLLLNADSLFDVDFSRLVQFHFSHNGLATIFVHPNSHPYDSGLIELNENNLVINWYSKEEKRPVWYFNLVNAGIHVLNPKVLNFLEMNGKIDLDRDVLKPLVKQKKVYGYVSSEYVKDMGTPERFINVENDLLSGKVHDRNLKFKQKAIFLDRDGTINKYVGFLTDIDRFELEDNVPEAIKKINNSIYLAIVVTNQPVIARGELTFEELNVIHKKMETLLGKYGAYLDDIFFCPHHPDSGFDGEVKELKVKCKCRKPQIGMLLKAADKYNIDLKNSWIIGDSITDILCGKNAGCKTGYIGYNKDCISIATVTGGNLLEVINKILEE